MCILCRATPISHSSEDITHSTSDEHDQPNGHLISSITNGPSQIAPYISRHRRGSVDSTITKNLTINTERQSSTTSSSCSSRPLSPIDDTKPFNFESLHITDRPHTPEGSKLLSESKPKDGSYLSSAGIPHKYSDPASHDLLIEAPPQPPLRKGHIRASSVGASPLSSQKGHKRMDSHSTCMSVSQ